VGGGVSGGQSAEKDALLARIRDAFRAAEDSLLVPTRDGKSQYRVGVAAGLRHGLHIVEDLLRTSDLPPGE
jgi:hypothetical protein